MELKTLRPPQNSSGYEELAGLVEGDMIEISKTIGGVKTTILEYEPPEGMTSSAQISFNVIEE